MTFQRPARVSKPMSDMITPRTLLAFFDECAKQLNSEGKEDEAFYFEQVADYLRSGKDISSDPRKITTILGL